MKVNGKCFLNINFNSKKFKNFVRILCIRLFKSGKYFIVNQIS